MDSASAWPAAEHWDRGTRLVFAVADKTGRPQAIGVWLRPPERRQL
jgi:hypothetical protein